MFISNRFATMTKLTLAVVAAVTTASIVSPAFAESSYHRDGSGKGPQVVRPHATPSHSKSARSAFGMASGAAQWDPNGPEATGGGSLGYNRKLLEF
jgi:hypothetical protein